MTNSELLLSRFPDNIKFKMIPLAFWMLQLLSVSNYNEINIHSIIASSHLTDTPEQFWKMTFLNFLKQNASYTHPYLDRSIKMNG